MTKVILRLHLLSATTFGRGDGVAGLVDGEIEHTPEEGFPFLRGRALKGLLREAAEDVAFALGWPDNDARLQFLFGKEGSGLDTSGKLHVSDAHLPSNLRALLRQGIKDQELTKDEVFAALTGIRRQTAMNVYGGPQRASLRAMRVVLRKVVLEAELTFTKEPEPQQWALLAGAVLALRAAGTGRNRGRGRVQATLWVNGADVTREKFNLLKGGD